MKINIGVKYEGSAIGGERCLAAIHKAFPEASFDAASGGVMWGRTPDGLTFEIAVDAEPDEIIEVMT